MRKKALFYSFLFLFYLILAVIVSYPLIENWGTHIIGEFDKMQDLEGTLWLEWGFKNALLQGKSPFYTDIDYYPYGYYLVPIIGNIFDSFISIPFQLMFKGFTYYNVMCFFILIANAFSGYALARYFKFERPVCIVCSIIFSFNPYVFFEMWHGRIGQSVLFFASLYVIYLFKVFEEGRRLDFLLAALFFLLTCLIYWFYGFFLILFSLLYIAHLLLERRLMLWEVAKRFLRLSLIILICLMPIFLTYLHIFRLYESTGAASHDHIRFFQSFPPGEEVISSKLLDDRKFILDLSVPVTNPFEFQISTSPPSLMLITLLIPLMFLVTRKESPRFFFLTCLFFLVLSWGPYLKTGSTFVTFLNTPVPLPYLLFYKYLPFFSRFYYPDRLESMMLLCLVPLVGYSLTIFFNGRSFSSSQKYLISALFVAVFLAEMGFKGYFPLKVSKIEVPEFYHEIARQEEGAIVNIPIGGCHNAIYFQIFHRKPILGGYEEFDSSQYSEEYASFLRRNKFLYRFYDLKKVDAFNPAEMKKDSKELILFGFRYVIIHKNQFKAPGYSEENISCEDVLSLLKEILGPPLYRTEQQEVFLLTGRPPE